MNIVTAILDVLAPRHCLVCGRILGVNESHLCLHCDSDIPLTWSWTHERNPIADAFNEALAAMSASEAGVCDPSVRYAPSELSFPKSNDFGPLEGLDNGVPENPGSFGVSRPRAAMPSEGSQTPASGIIPAVYFRAAALMYYREGDGYRNILRALKYDGDIRAGRKYSRMLGSFLASSELFRDVDTVVPVPLHWRRLLSRGYNQSAVIAREIARSLNATYAPSVLRRTRRTTSQVHRSFADRSRNVLGAFSAGKIPPSARHILIVDDTFTTGSTLAACTLALLNALPADSGIRISVVTLAKVDN